jgi:hypothetical protein
MRPAPVRPDRRETPEEREARTREREARRNVPPRPRRILPAIVICGLIGIGLALFLRSRVVTPAPAAAAPATTLKSPDQVRTEEIVKANAGQPGDPALAADYQSINAEYFDGRLPPVVLRWEPRLDEVGPMIAEGFRMSGVTDGRLILLNPAIRADADEYRRVLCHEIVHLAVVAEPQAHGPAFQAYLRQLLVKGAFKGVVATEQEKQDRRHYLDRKLADLGAEAALIAQEKARIEADAGAGEAPAADLTARQNQYNDRVRRHNDAVVEFNRSVEEYNQMVSYPDGLDRERMARSTSVPAGS